MKDGIINARNFQREIGVRGTLYRDVFIAVMLVVAVSVSGLLSEHKNYIITDNEASCGIYCLMATKYSTFLADHSFDKYYFSKSLSSLVAHVISRLFDTGTHPTTMNLILEIISAVAAVASCVLWWAISRALMFSVAAFWVGVLGLFANQLFFWEITRQQESPDMIALLVGTAFLYAFIIKAVRWQYIILALSYFVQPQAALFMIPMILVQRGADVGNNDRDNINDRALKIITPITSRLSILIKNRSLGIKVLLSFYTISFLLVAYIFPMIKAPYHGIANTMQDWLPLSIILAIVMMTWALIKLKVYENLEGFLTFLTRAETLKRLGVILVIITAKTIIITYFGRGQVLAVGGVTGTAWILYSFQYHLIEQPLKSIVAHYIYFGPIIILILLQWGKILETSNRLRLGSGFIVTLIAVVVFSPDAESRHLIAFLPWVMTVVIASIGSLGIFQFIAVIAFSLMSSRFFIGSAIFSQTDDRWLQTWGPWWPVSTYLVASVVFISTLVIFVVARKIDGRASEGRL